MSEPGLVLTPPTEPTSLDDGYLGLSEVMDLELSAELVILSACNTAAGDGRSNASGLSGLARGFLNAGAGAVAVTHWSIPSEATLSLNVRWFSAKSTSPELDWAAALREAVTAMIEVEGPATFAHPANWGAFEVFGAM
ncbi:CHAT domain protein [Devosia sp. LC5]|uniref:CHAT domain-containing protein n=1 Tax=Devosia sp. LC5 TaxID=1502724 RepID=UPI0004E332B3|nr:CHAT domain-containing protein [Devosia sp. LC5]KFC70260.1 CHAT domain protein [Devosia sp. LC5]